MFVKEFERKKNGNDQSWMVLHINLIIIKGSTKIFSKKKK
jgi:hypothetical protein